MTLFVVGTFLVFFFGGLWLFGKAAMIAHRDRLAEQAEVVRRGIELRDAERAAGHR